MFRSLAIFIALTALAPVSAAVAAESRAPDRLTDVRLLAAQCAQVKTQFDQSLQEGDRLIQQEERDVQAILHWCARQPATLGRWQFASERHRQIRESGVQSAIDLLKHVKFDSAEYDSLVKLGNRVAERIAKGKTPEEVSIPFLDNPGTPYERGLEHGRVFRRQITEGYDFWGRKRVADATPFNVTVKDKIVAYLNDHCPEVAQELRGIADGSGLSFDQIVWLNAFNSVFKVKAPQSCSNIVLRAADGTLSLGTTADIDADQRRMMLHRRVRDGKRDFHVIGWYGTVWVEMALTRSGLAVGADSAPSYPNQDGYGIGQHFGAYPVLLRADTVQQAIDEFAKLKFTGKGLIFGLADATGDGAILEKSGLAQAVLRLGAQDSGILGTNDFQSPAMSVFNGERAGATFQYCQDRRDRFAEWLPGTRAVQPIGAIKDLISSAPFCQFGQALPLITEAATVSTPTKGIMHITGLSPSRGIYSTWSFKD